MCNTMTGNGLPDSFVSYVATQNNSSTARELIEPIGKSGLKPGETFEIPYDQGVLVVRYEGPKEPQVSHLADMSDPDSGMIRARDLEAEVQPRLSIVPETIDDKFPKKG